MARKTYFCRNTDDDTVSEFLRMLLRFPLSNRKLVLEEWNPLLSKPQSLRLWGSTNMTKWASAKHTKMPVSTTMRTPIKFLRIFRLTKGTLRPGVILFHWCLESQWVHLIGESELEVFFFVTTLLSVHLYEWIERCVFVGRKTTSTRAACKQ